MTERANQPVNFIQQIIDDDIAAGKHKIIRTRFPPEPNGFLHIGHAKSICLNFELARQYNSTCYLRFDDTNPEKEEEDYINAIQEDIQWLGYKWNESVRYSSDYFVQLYNYAGELVTKNLAYVCFLNSEEIRKDRGTLTQSGKNSPYRNTSVKENLRLLTKMRQGKFKEGECTLRAKIDMASPIICMRDPVFYRIKYINHHRTKDAWCIYPTYDFTHCISDALEGITHSLCTLEFQDNRVLYDWILNHISITCHPKQYEFSRLNLEHTILSKRKLNQLVAERYVTGWDDPRMPTIAGMRRRGYSPSAIKEFIRRIGVTKQDSLVEFSSLESCLREQFEQSAPRAMAVLNPIKLIIDNYPPEQTEKLNAFIHPKNPQQGMRQLSFTKELYIDGADFQLQANKQYKRLTLDKEVRLRNAYIIKAVSVEYDKYNNIKAIHCQYDPNTLGRNPNDKRKVKGVIHWVSATVSLPAIIRIYHPLFTTRNPSATPQLATAINHESLTVYNQARVELGLGKAKHEQVYQFEREGYFCLDSKEATEDQLVFNRTIALRDNWQKNITKQK